MIELPVAKLRANLSAVLEWVRGGETVVIRRNGARIAILSGTGKKNASGIRRLRGAPSKMPTLLDTGTVKPLTLRSRPKRAPSEEISAERQ